MDNPRTDPVVKMINVLISCKTLNQFNDTIKWIRSVSISDYETSFIIEQALMFFYLNPNENLH